MIVVESRYKATGKHSGVVQGKRDGFENFLVSYFTDSGK